MKFKKTSLALCCSAVMFFSACSDDAKTPKPQAKETSYELSFLGRYISGNDFATSSAEIVSYDASTDKVYVVNAQDKTVDVLGFDDNKPIKSSSIDLGSAATDAGISIGAANSVAVHDGLVAVAIENADKQDNGIIALYRSSDLQLLNTFTAGALPDMVTFSKDGKYILSANEGEPSTDYKNDPEGSVTIIGIENGTDDANAVVNQVDFKAFNNGSARHSELDDDTRLTLPNGATVAQDLEPEYIAVSDSGKAYVSLQENNAVAIIDIASQHVDKIVGLGEKSWASVADGGQGYKLDLTNKDGIYQPQSYPQLVGLYMPDSMSTFTIAGDTYVITANEGDGREYIYETTQQDCEQNAYTWDGDDYTGTADYDTELDDCIAHIDEGRGDDLVVDNNHPLMNESVYGIDGTIANKNAIGRIKVLMDETMIGAQDNVKTFGARSFSIWDADMNLVFDSGDELASRANTAVNFNASNDAQEADNRSDDKGIEPEAVEVAVIGGKTLAFIGLERQGGIAMYDVSKPSSAKFLDYINTRDFTVDVCTGVDGDGECDNDEYNPQVGDLGPESIEYIYRENKHFIAVGNEVSGTTSVFEIVAK